MGVNFWQITFIFQFFLLIWWSSKQGWETLNSFSVFLFANSQHRSVHFRACHSMSWNHTEVCARGLSHPGNFSVAPAEIRDSNIFLNCSMIVSFGLHSRWVHPEYTWSRNDVGSSMATSFINFFHIGAKFCFFPANLCHPHRPIRTIFVFLRTNKQSQFGTFPNQFPSMLFRTVFPTRVLRVGVHISFVQQEQQDPQCIPMTSAIYVLEDVSIDPDILILEF